MLKYLFFSSPSSFFISFLLLSQPVFSLRIDQTLVPGAFQILTHFVNNTEFLESLLNHGCWCAKLNPENQHFHHHLGGKHPVDDLDTICKQWAQNRNCLKTAGFSCENVENIAYYEISYANGIEDAFCPDVDQCLSESCQTDLFYTIQLLQNMNSTFNSNSNPVCTEPIVTTGESSVSKTSTSNNHHCSLITTTILPETVEAVVTKCQNVVSDITVMFG